MKILLISAYHASSHRAWAKHMMQALPQYEWHELSLPDHYFAWRIRGNAYSLAFSPEFQDVLQQDYDLVLATSMTDVVGLKAFCPQLARCPWLLYFHENQFAYPFSAQQQGQIEMQMVTLYSALAADACLFNSEFNRQTFLDGATKLLRKLPDYNSLSGIDRIREKSQVLPVPIPDDAVYLAKHTEKQTLKSKHEPRPIRIVWAARWEYDKGPERLLAFIEQAKLAQLPFELSVLGEKFRRYPEAFDQIEQQHADVLRHFGFLPSRQAYLQALAEADIFLSTALHEFQGISMMEAVTLGCRPLLPNRQVYPEWFGEAYLYDVSDIIEMEAKAAVNAVENVLSLPVPKVSSYFPEALYRSLVEKIESLIKA